MIWSIFCLLLIACYSFRTVVATAAAPVPPHTHTHAHAAPVPPDSPFDLVSPHWRLAKRLRVSLPAFVSPPRWGGALCTGTGDTRQCENVCTIVVAHEHMSVQVCA